MNFADLIKERNIDLTLSADSKFESILSMVELSSHCQKIDDSGYIAQRILHYEVMASSFNGSCGVVFHSLSDRMSAPKLFFGRFIRGNGHSSKVSCSIDLIFLLTASSKFENELENTLKKLDRLIQQQPLRKLLQPSKSPEEILELLVMHLDREKGAADVE